MTIISDINWDFYLFTLLVSLYIGIFSSGIKQVVDNNHTLHFWVLFLSATSFFQYSTTLNSHRNLYLNLMKIQLLLFFCLKLVYIKYLGLGYIQIWWNFDDFFVRKLFLDLIFNIRFLVFNFVFRLYLILYCIILGTLSGLLVCR